MVEEEGAFLGKEMQRRICILQPRALGCRAFRWYGEQVAWRPTTLKLGRPCAGRQFWLSCIDSQHAKSLRRGSAILLRPLHNLSRSLHADRDSCRPATRRDDVEAENTTKPARENAQTFKETHRCIQGAASADEIYAVVREASNSAHELDALALTAAFHRIAILEVQAHRIGRNSSSADFTSSRTHHVAVLPSAPDAPRRPTTLKLGNILHLVTLLEDLSLANMAQFGAHHCSLTLY
jgi:hypothetical protein